VHVLQTPLVTEEISEGAICRSGELSRMLPRSAPRGYPGPPPLCAASPPGRRGDRPALGLPRLPIPEPRGPRAARRCWPAATCRRSRCCTPRAAPSAASSPTSSPAGARVPRAPAESNPSWPGPVVPSARGVTAQGRARGAGVAADGPAADGEGRAAAGLPRHLGLDGGPARGHLQGRGPQVHLRGEGEAAHVLPLCLRRAAGGQKLPSHL
jgi:hypothetical protein